MDLEKMKGAWFVSDIREPASEPIMVKKLSKLMREIKHTLLYDNEVMELVERLKGAQEEYYQENKRLKKVDIYIDDWGIDDEYLWITLGLWTRLTLTKVRDYHW